MVTMVSDDENKDSPTSQPPTIPTKTLFCLGGCKRFCLSVKLKKFNEIFSRTFLHRNLLRCGMKLHLLLTQRVGNGLISSVTTKRRNNSNINNNKHYFKMFQALFFQERDAVADIRAHEKEAATKKKPQMPRSPKLGPRIKPVEQSSIKKRPTQSNLVGGKGLFLNLDTKKQ